MNFWLVIIVAGHLLGINPMVYNNIEGCANDMKQQVMVLQEDWDNGLKQHLKESLNMEVSIDDVNVACYASMENPARSEESVQQLLEEFKAYQEEQNQDKNQN